jgi:hypothetical protein
MQDFRDRTRERAQERKYQVERYENLLKLKDGPFKTEAFRETIQILLIEWAVKADPPE